VARRLHAVGETGAPARQARKPAQKTVTAAAKSGSQRELLIALRDRIAKSVEDADTPPRDLASLSRRLMEISKELKALEAQESEEAGEHAVSPDEEWAGV
jgi:hypothetical protein